MIDSYLDSIVWQSSMKLVESVYRFSNNLNSKENSQLISQLRKTSVSIPSNIAEG